MDHMPYLSRNVNSSDMKEPIEYNIKKMANQPVKNPIFLTLMTASLFKLMVDLSVAVEMKSRTATVWHGCAKNGSANQLANANVRIARLGG